MASEQYRKGQWLFKKGDAADRLYLLKKGNLRLVEFDKVVPPGSVFGEVGVFSENEVRTSSAYCEEDCELFSITGEKAVELFYQDPRFGFYIVRALARYVSEGSNVYKTLASAEATELDIPPCTSASRC
jgi:CRP-like cAMP-binding protein